MKSLKFLLCLMLPVSLLAQIENFQIDIGQFFSQGYGSNYDEEAIDIAEGAGQFYFTGWQDTLKEETVSKDLVYYISNDRGKLLKRKVIGSPNYDEVGTGIAMVGIENFAISELQTSNFIPSKFSKVYQNDVLKVRYFDATGNLLWTYVHQNEENGLAPVDIRFFNSHLYVLANEYLGVGVFGVRVLKLNLSGQLVAISPSFTMGSGRIWCSELELMKGVLATIGNDQITKSPVHISFDPNSLQITGNHSLNTYNQHFLYGFVMDSVSGFYTAAGYEVDEESDTNALIMQLDPSFSPINIKRLGFVGVEKFRDIGLIGDGFIAAGVRNNKGLGGYNNYVSHLTLNLDTIMEETDGGETNERNSSLLITKDLVSAYTAGHNTQYGLVNSGNSYILGVLTVNAPNNWNFSCDIPRIIYIDEMLNPSNNSLSGSNMKNWTTTIGDVKSMNADIIFLYDVDKLLAVYGTISSQDQRIKDLKAFLNYAHQSPNDLSIGLVVGPSKYKVGEVTNALNGLKRWNYDFSDKINLVVLEHEFWNLHKLDQNGDHMTLSEFMHDPAHPTNPKFWNFHNSNLTFTRNPNGANEIANPFLETNALYNTSATHSERDDFFRAMVEDHFKMLEYLNDQKSNSAPIWKVFDYLAYTKNLALSSPPSGYYSGYTAKYYKELLSYTGPNPAIDIFDFTNYYGQRTRYKTAGTFLVYYRTWDPSGPNTHFSSNNLTTALPSYGLNIPNPSSADDYVYRLIELADDNTWIPPYSTMEPFRVIPLHSAEEPTCGENLMGAWLGNGNRYNIVEWEYANQYRDDFKLYHSSITPEIKHVANAWFKYSCMRSQFGSFSLRTSPATEPFTGIHDIFKCHVYSIPTIPIGVVEDDVEDAIDVYPNPVQSKVTVSYDNFNEQDNYLILLSSLDGRVVFKSELEGAKHEINLQSLPQGVYVIQLVSQNETIFIDKIIKSL